MKKIEEMTPEEIREEMRFLSTFIEDDGMALKILIALQGAEILQELRTSSRTEK